ncbi:hypothetical protein EDD86DRAFT_263814 [Gorgonomyces haynaldii]|nr:hypothetical protein EDD86DRAFT_263814 [Gorgonomyces haynaldii]
MIALQTFLIGFQSLMLLVILSQLLFLIFRAGPIGRRTRMIPLTFLTLLTAIALLWHIISDTAISQFVEDLFISVSMMEVIIGEMSFLSILSMASRIPSGRITLIIICFRIFFVLTIFPVLAVDIMILCGIREYMDIREYCLVAWAVGCLGYEVWQCVFMYIVLRNYSKIKFDKEDSPTDEKKLSTKALKEFQMLCICMLAIDATSFVFACVSQSQDGESSRLYLKMSDVIIQIHILSLYLMFQTVKSVAFPDAQKSSSSASQPKRRLFPIAKQPALDTIKIPHGMNIE